MFTGTWDIFANVEAENKTYLLEDTDICEQNMTTFQRSLTPILVTIKVTSL